MSSITNLNNAINNWIIKGGSVKKFKLASGNPFSRWNKIYLSYNKKSGWKIVELNIFQRFVRKVFGAYKNTRLANVKAYSPEKFENVEENIQTVFNKIVCKLALNISDNGECLAHNLAPDYRGYDIKKTDAVLKRTSQGAVNKIYDTLEILDDILRDVGIEYCMCCGIQLGAIRQTGIDGKGPGGIIPWDDDGDIAILKKDFEQFKQLKEKFAEKEYELIETKYCWKLQHKDGKPYTPDKEPPGLSGESVKFPFVDIFIIGKSEGKDQDKYYYVNKEAQDLWDYEYYTEEEWNNITDVRLGHLKLCGLKGEHAKNYLNRVYQDKKARQPTWENKVARTWDHEDAAWLGNRIVDLVDRTHPVKLHIVDNLENFQKGLLLRQSIEEARTKHEKYYRILGDIEEVRYKLKYENNPTNSKENKKKLSKFESELFNLVNRN
ncbi:MAG: hypothetical protein K940chlam3_01434 [Chlamydiae bacterium]|nr:hypothetical protein [Chlamydiota bacterium]